MKTLPEILDPLFSGELYDELHGAFIKVRSTKQIDEAQEAIAKELMGCLPEKRVRKSIEDEYDSVNWCGTCDQIFNLDGECWCKPYNQALDEVRARLTAFIGKDSNENS